MSGETVLHLFVSSPGDVWRERERVDFVVERLNAEFRGRAQIRAIRWETSYYSSHETFQAQIPEASACDLVLAIFGARLGSPLPETFPPMPSGERYASGTAYEVLSAIEARRRGQGVPDVYVFRRPTAPLVALDAPDRPEIEAQWRRLTAFFETWFRNRGGEFLAAFQEFATTDEFAAKVADCLRQWLARRGFPPKAETWDRAKLGSPYPGLASFDESRQSVFFGRSLVIDQAIRRLREVEAPANETARAPFLLLIGASGSGKSSLLRAGLMPKVGLPGVLPEVDLWRRAITAPGLDPFLTLAESLLAPEALGPELASGPFRARELLAKQLAGDPDAAVAPLRGALEAAAEARRKQEHFETPRPARLFLAIDQAERLLVETPAELQPRFATLIAALCRHRIATVVLALRSDAYARFQALDAFVALRDAGATLDLLPATQSELEEMSTRPAALCEPALAFERRDGLSLATTLVADARGGDALPLLQMTLARLSAAEAGRGDGVLRFADYRGLGEAVSETANEALAALDAAARAELPRLIVGLVRDFTTDPVSGEPSAAIGALDRSAFEAGHPERKALVEAFVAKRLLTAEGDAASQRVRPTHESLLRIWPEAVAILAEAAHLIRARAAIEPAAREWADAPPGDKARHLEISPALLEGAMAYVERFADEADSTTRRFIVEAAAVAEARRERERRDAERRIADAEAIARANRRIARGIGVGLVVALLLAGLAGWQWFSASVARREAQRQRDRAERALAAATQTADSLVFDIAQKVRDLTGVPKPVVKDILDQARKLQEQLLNSGESSSKLTSNHAAALGEIAVTELSLGDTADALALAQQSRDIYAKISSAAPDDARFIHDLDYSEETIGDILQRQGKFDEAKAAYDRALAMVVAAIEKGRKDTRLRQDRSVILGDLGSLARARGDLPGAETLFRADLAIALELVNEQPNDTATSHAVAVARRSLGDILLQRGDIDAAAAEFAPASEIAHRLAEENPGNALLQRDYTLSQERLGETLTAKRDYAGALKAFSDGEDTAIKLAATDAANLEWQYDISIGHIEVGDTEVALGDSADAVKSFRAAATIDKALTAKDSTNALWRTHYGVSLERLGGALETRAAPGEALAVYQDALSFGKQALADSPGGDWASYVVRAEGRIGDLLQKLSKFDEAMDAYKDALARSRALGADRPARDLLYINLTRVGGALTLRGDAGAAAAAYDEAERLQRAIIAEDPKPAGARGQLAALLVSKAHVQVKLGHPNDAIAGLREAFALSQALAAENPAEPLWRREQAVAEDRLGDVLRDTGDEAGAIEAYRGSLAMDDALPAAVKNGAEQRAVAALTREALAAVLENRKDPAIALASITEALALRRAVAEDAPDDARKRRAWLVDENNDARQLIKAGKVEEGLALLREGLGLARSLAALPQADATARNDLVISLFLVGTTLAGQKDWTGAAADLGEAMPIIQALASSAPDKPRYAGLVGSVATNLGDALAMRQDYAGALRAYVVSSDAEKAALAANPADRNAADQLRLNVTKIGYLANALLLASDFRGALAALNEATPAAPDQNWLDLVRAAALMFLGQSDEARALYEKHRGEKTYAGKSWETAAVEGFAVLRTKGLDNPLMAEIEAEFAAPK